MPMKNPPHPGSVVLSECIEPLGITITQAARTLDVTRTTLSELVNGKRGISPEMAARLSQVFGGSAQSWITQQAHYDLAQIPVGRIRLKRLAAARWYFGRNRRAANTSSADLIRHRQSLWTTICARSRPLFAIQIEKSSCHARIANPLECELSQYRLRHLLASTSVSRISNCPFLWPISTGNPLALRNQSPHGRLAT
jgi:antitoxin HigA-1